MIASFAPAKVNLYLHVTARRADGYHLLDSLAVFPNIGDRVTVAPAATLSLAIDGPFAHSLQADPDNLVLRAARALHPAGGAAIRLTKNLPVASGIGGGSADAAAALRALAWLWGLAEPDPEVALRLGADVPVCLRRQSARMGGIGEELRPAPQLPGFGILLVNPGVAVATAAIFKSRNAAFSPPAALPEFWPSAAAMAADLATLTNDLAAPAIRLAPVIGDVLAALNSLPGCLLARMSGSGATCFGLFGSPAAATHAATLLPQPNWWRWGGGLYEPAAPDL